MRDKKVGSVREIDFSALHVPCIAVYKNPADFPGQSVARVFDLNKPTDTIMVRDNPAEIAVDILEYTSLVFIPRMEGDVPPLVGVWM